MTITASFPSSMIALPDSSTRMGSSSLMDGFYHLYATNEERWGFLAAYVSYMEDCPVGAPYRQLRELLEGREYFVLTTNVDGQVRRAFP